MEDDRDPELGRRLADWIEAGGVLENPWTHGWSLTPRMPWSRTQRWISSAAPASLGSTFANATNRPPPPAT